MRIIINPVYDLETMALIQHDGVYEYEGPCILFKGDSTAQAAEKSQASFDNSLQNIFQAQYGKQSQITNYLTNQMEPLIAKGGQGMSPEALAAARTQSTDTLSNQFQGAQRAVNATEQRGLPSGVNAQVSGSMMAQEAEAQAQGQNNITAQNEALKQQNYWNSVNVLNGEAATENPLGYANASTSGSNAVAEDSKASAYTNANSFSGELGAAFAGTLGKAAGVATGGALFGA